MAAPSFVDASAGAVVTTGSGNVTLGVASIGDVVLFQVLQDGSGTAPGITSNAVLSDLAGSGANTFTTIGTFDVGAAIAKQHLLIARAITTASPIWSVTGVGDDCYIRSYRFSNVNAGSTLAAVIENGTAGSTANGTGLSTSVLDTAVTTLGPDRLALNFVGIDDDATGLAAFAGMTGGTWGLATAIFESATGRDGTIALMTAAMASAGTIDGGSDTITSDNWGVVGFALIGTTSAVTLPPPPTVKQFAVTRSYSY